MGDSPKFVGTWKLISQYSHYPDGQVVASRGEDPAGILMYDAHGNMAVQLMRTDARTAHTDLAQLATAMESFLAYFGTYEVDEAEQLVRHHVIGASYPSYRGSVQVRAYHFDGDILTLKATAPQDNSTRVIVWELMGK